MQNIVLATGNKGKIIELQKYLDELNYKILPMSDFNISEPIEDGLSFVENAIIKARHASKLTNLPAIADDSGLSVDALQGKPGIYSSRFSGENATDQSNIDKLLNEMQGIENRKANFHCTLVYVKHHLDPQPIICSGNLHGEIITDQIGAGGFGYDPIFWLPQQNCTLAELTKEEKNKISHRGIALKKLLKEMK